MSSKPTNEYYLIIYTYPITIIIIIYIELTILYYLESKDGVGIRNRVRVHLEYRIIIYLGVGCQVVWRQGRGGG